MIFKNIRVGCRLLGEQGRKEISKRGKERLSLLSIRGISGRRESASPYLILAKKRDYVPGEGKTLDGKKEGGTPRSDDLNQYVNF